LSWHASIRKFTIRRPGVLRRASASARFVQELKLATVNHGRVIQIACPQAQEIGAGSTPSDRRLSRRRTVTARGISETRRDKLEAGFPMTELPSVDCSACGSANDPRCGGRGRDQGGNHARRDPSTCWPSKVPWNKGRLIGQKGPLKPKELWTIRVRLQLEQRRRDLALFNLAIDSKLRGCDLVRLRLSDVCVGGQVRDRTTVIQQKTGRPVQFEITEQTRAAIRDWLASTGPAIGQTSSQAAFMNDRTFRHDNTLGSSIYGSSAPASTARLMGPTRCGERRRLKFTRRPAI
jgi:hypothetical protein